MKIFVKFKECDACSAKSGSPVLCSGCLHNRSLIEKYNDLLNKIVDRAKEIEESRLP